MGSDGRPGKPIDSGRWFVICVNALGSCKGSTGPASIDPATGRPYRLDFPELSIEDGADAAAAVVRALGIERLACVIGNSMGAMMSLALLARHSGHRAFARQHFRRGARPAVLHRDPLAAKRGDPPRPEVERRRLRRRRLSRIGHAHGAQARRHHLPLGAGWDGRFGRVRLEDEREDDDPFGFEFQVESYLEGHARRFVRRFDPNSYLYLSRSMDWYDLGEGHGGDVRAGLAAIRVERALAIGVHTDILFPLQQQEEIAEGLAAGGADAGFLPCPRRRATTPSWWTSSASARRSPAS